MEEVWNNDIQKVKTDVYQAARVHLEVERIEVVKKNEVVVASENALAVDDASRASIQTGKAVAAPEGIHSILVMMTHTSDESVDDGMIYALLEKAVACSGSDDNR